jgi:hypothetical protein
MAMTPRLPKPDAAQRLCNKLLEHLRPLPCIEQIAVFGSLADHSSDALSDVDLFVICPEPTQDAWPIIATIRAHMPVLFYRMFSSDSQPAGRYWFADESPLTRLDISFHTPEQFEQLNNTKMYLGSSVQIRTLYRSSQPACPPCCATNSVPQQQLLVPEYENMLGEYIYRILRAIKHVLRGTPFHHPLPICIHTLNEIVLQTKQKQFAGGDGHALATSCLQLAEMVSTNQHSDTKHG